MEEALVKAGGMQDPRVDMDLVTYIYEKFTEIVENLVVRTDFPLEESDPGNFWNHLSEYCYRASLFFPEPGYKALRIIAYEEWYKAMLRHEKGKASRTIHKGMPLHQLGIFYFESGEKVLAKKYLQLAYIEDIQEFKVGNRPSHIGQAYRLLKSGLLVSAEELKALKKNTKFNQGEKYPEKIFLEFSLDRGIYKNRATEDKLLVINRDYALFLLDKARTLKRAADIGAAFTKLVSYLFSTVGGFAVVGQNIVTKTREHDYDILVRNLITNDPVYEEFGKYIVAECKFVESKKAGIDVLTKLLYKIKYHDCNCGVLFSRKGVAFGEKLNMTIKKAYNRDSVAILSVKESEIKEVIDGKSERGSHPVYRRPMRQWMLKITEYADRLLEDLEGLDWPESTKEMQRNWIGKSEGAEVDQCRDG